MDESPAYLQPGFDPSTLRVAELRGLLLEHDVDYAMTAKKAQLVDLFNEHIASRAQRITDQRNNVRASSRGIVSVDQQGNAVAEEPKRSSRRVRRKSVVDTDEDGASGDNVLRSPTKRTSSRTASPTKRAMRQSRLGIEDETPRAVRSTRRSGSRLAEPASETPSPPPKAAKREEVEAEKSPFSLDNVFQKGSPVARATPPAPESRRKTLQPRTEEKKSSRAGRRLTDFLPPSPPEDSDPDSFSYNQHAAEQYEPITQPTKKRFEVPVSRLQYTPLAIVSPDRAVVKIEKTDDDDLIPAGEEFTPEGAQEVAEAEEEAAIVPRRTRRRRTTATPTASMLWVVVGTLLSAYFVWWRKEKIEIGYCGVGYTAPIASSHHDDQDWATLLRPECEPCPPNAVCKPNFTADCKSDYVLVNNPLSLFGLIPLPPTCEPDSEKLRRIAILSDEAIKVLRKRAADVDCGEVTPIKPNLASATDEEGKGGAGPVIKARDGGPLAEGKGMEESELRKMLYDLKAPKLTDAQFDELFKATLEDVGSREEIESNEDSQHRLILASTSLAAIPLQCSIRLSLLRTLATYRLEILATIVAIFAILHINHKVQQRRHNSALVTKYVHMVFRLLARKAEMAYRSGREEDAAVAVVQMRDQVMQHEFNADRRKRVWEGVQAVVEHNSNVRATSREVRGEVLRCWTWIGAVGVLEDVLGGGGEGGALVKRENGVSLKREDWERDIEFPRIVA